MGQTRIQKARNVSNLQKMNKRIKIATIIAIAVLITAVFVAIAFTSKMDTVEKVLTAASFIGIMIIYVIDAITLIE